MRVNISEKIVWSVQNEVQAPWSFLTNMACSGILTTIAFLTNSVPVLIGAMVVAPVLPPLQLIPFGLVSGHLRLALKGAALALTGLAFACLFAGLTTIIVNSFEILDQSENLFQKPLLEERTRPGIYSILVGFTAGIAGCLAMAKKKIDALVGVVSSVALVPALGAASIAFIEGDMPRVLGGITLFAVNFLTIIGSGIMMLSLLGRRISKEEEEKKEDEEEEET